MNEVFTHFVLISTLEKVLAVWLPCNNIRESRAKLWILIIAGNLTSLEPETCVNPKALVVKISSEWLEMVTKNMEPERIQTRTQIPWQRRPSLLGD